MGTFLACNKYRNHQFGTFWLDPTAGWVHFPPRGKVRIHFVTAFFLVVDGLGKSAKNLLENTKLSVSNREWLSLSRGNRHSAFIYRSCKSIFIFYFHTYLPLGFTPDVLFFVIFHDFFIDFANCLRNRGSCYVF